MRNLFGLSPELTTQERVTRLALGCCLMLMILMPLPFVWHPYGMLYPVYLIPICFGFYPLTTKELTEKRTFHWLFGIVLIVVTISIKNWPIQCIPLLFALLTVYFMYWQLEKRLYAIRKAIQDYEFAEVEATDLKAMVTALVKSSLRKALVPAAAGTLACAVGLIPVDFAAPFFAVVFGVVFFLMRQKLSMLSK